MTDPLENTSCIPCKTNLRLVQREDGKQFQRTLAETFIAFWQSVGDENLRQEGKD